MTLIDFGPAPGAAPPARRVISHARTEAALLVRNGEQLLLALVIPAGILVLGRFAATVVGPLRILAPSVLALAVWSSAFTSLAIATAFERRYGVLERLAATPLRKGGLLLGKAIATTLIALGQLVILTALALLLGWRPVWSALAALLGVIAIVLAGASFAGLALALAGRLRAEATLALANLIYVVLLVGGGLVVPVGRYPAALRPVISLLPTAALGEGLRAYGNGILITWPLLVLLVWCLISTGLAWRGFRWTS